ncbi:Aldo/keto reductase [Apiospora arundinis]
MGRSGYDTTGLPSLSQPIDTPASICTEATEDLEEAHPLHTLRTQFLHLVMAAHKRAADDLSQTGSDLAEGGNELAVSLGNNNENESEPSTKRVRWSDGDSSTLVGTDTITTTTTTDKQLAKSINKRRTQSRRLWLACPFAKKDPVRYRNCYRYNLGRIRAVKQHLSRCHRKPIYCPICRRTFKDEDERDKHIRLNNCSRRPEIEIYGISEKQKRELGQRVCSKMPEEQQWFTVFDTLFAPLSRPRSPYIDRDLSEQMSVFHDFYTSKGPELLLEFLESTGVVTWSLPQEERDLATFQEGILGDGLLQIWDHWTNANTIQETCNAESGTPAASQSQNSGVLLHDMLGNPSEVQDHDGNPNNDSPIMTTVKPEAPRIIESGEEVPKIRTTSDRDPGDLSPTQNSSQASQELDDRDWSGISRISPPGGALLHDILSEVYSPSMDGFANTDILPDFDFNISWQ